MIITIIISSFPLNGNSVLAEEEPELKIEFPMKGDHVKTFYGAARYDDSDTVEVYLTVSNIGNASATNIVVNVYSAKGYIIANETINELKPKSNLTITWKLEFDAGYKTQLEGVATTRYNGTNYTATTPYKAEVRINSQDACMIPVIISGCMIPVAVLRRKMNRG